jgi:hypothetical protein
MTIDPAYLRADGTLRALTLWPEWAWAVHFLDKDLENRTWEIPDGEWFGLHAGMNVGGRKGVPATVEGWEAVRFMAGRAGWTPAEGTYRLHDYRKGDRSVSRDPMKPLESHLHGLMRVKDYVTRGSRSWYVPGQIGNVFEYRPLVEPVPCSGKQGLWRVPSAVVERMVVLP